MFSTEIIVERLRKSNELDCGGYSHNLKRDAYTVDVLNYVASEALENGEKAMDVTMTISGRIVLKRVMGNLIFLNIQDSKGDVQLFISKSNVEEGFKEANKLSDMGDIVLATGHPMRTQKGGISLFVTSIKIITKALLPLPDKFAGLNDVETKYRKRYLDMIVNPEVRDRFKMRSNIISDIRTFFRNKAYYEVETPMLNAIPGGANAKPFITHHNALGQDRYLRIAPELYLKRLIIGGFDKVFEIGKNFRNEGIDATHNPEFTSIEFYETYTDYKELMVMIQELLQKLGKSVGTSKLNRFETITYEDVLIKYTGLTKEKLSSIEEIENFLFSSGTKFKKQVNLGKYWELLFDDYVESNLVNPTFIIDYPIEISPLARKKDDNPNLAERFELFIEGKEIANGFNELNDPVDQYNRFLSQVANKDSDDESMFMDKEYIEALMQGMPPVAGAGIGIDRLVMLLTNTQSIRDVIIFPALRN